MKEISLSDQELRFVRTEIALSIIDKFPQVYKKLYSDKGYTMNETEALAAGMLKGILEADPCIKRELDFYQQAILI